MLGRLFIHLQNKLASCLILGCLEGREGERVRKRLCSLWYLSFSSQAKKEANWYVISSLCVFVPTEAFLESLKEGFLCHFGRDFMQLGRTLRMLFFHLNFMLYAAVIFSLKRKRNTLLQQFVGTNTGAETSKEKVEQEKSIRS